MAKAQRVTYFKITIEDAPGALLAIGKHLKSRNVGLVGVEASGTEPGKSEALCFPRNPDKLRDALKSSTIPFEEGSAFFLKGKDKTGVLLKSLSLLADAGINLVSTQAIAVKGNFGAIIRVATGDAGKAGQALGVR
jgi:hypothetical protein